MIGKLRLEARIRFEVAEDGLRETGVGIAQIRHWLLAERRVRRARRCLGRIERLWLWLRLGLGLGIFAVMLRLLWCRLIDGFGRCLWRLWRRGDRRRWLRGGLRGRYRLLDCGLLGWRCGLLGWWLRRIRGLRRGGGGLLLL